MKLILFGVLGPSTYCLLTIIERKTRYLYASRLNTRKSNVVCNEIINIMKPLLPKKYNYG